MSTINAATAPIDLFMASRNEPHPTGLAHLRGARLVVATETDGGQRWDESKIKLLTGGDKITCRCFGSPDAESKKILEGFGTTYHQAAPNSFALNPRADRDSQV